MEVIAILISEKIPIILNKRLAQYYKGFGYDISDNVIYVWTYDLPRYSTKNVHLKCDLCGKIFEDLYCNHRNRQHMMRDKLRDKCDDCKKQRSLVISPGYMDSMKNSMKSWRIDTLKYFNYKCEITGIQTNTVHHIYDFKYLLSIALERLRVTTDDFNSQYEKLFSEVKKECMIVHYEYGLGAALYPSIHMLFHSIYSTHSTTVEQYEEFKNIIRLINIDAANLTTRDRLRSAKELYMQTYFLKAK